MHEYRRYVEREMHARHWTQADLARASGLNRQNINAITKDTREVLPGIPKESTVNGLARAFNVKPEVVLARVAIAMGLPASVVTTDAADLSDTDLLTEVRKRMEARHASQAEDEAGSDPDVPGTRDRTPMTAEDELAQRRRDDTARRARDTTNADIEQHAAYRTHDEGDE